jgi:hypothetical protein
MVDITNLHNIGGIFYLKLKDGTQLGPLMCSGISGLTVKGVNYSLIQLPAYTRLAVNAAAIESGWR